MKWLGEAAFAQTCAVEVDLERHREGESPCAMPPGWAATVFGESGCLGTQPKAGGKHHLKLNTGTRPIANKN